MPHNTLADTIHEFTTLIRNRVRADACIGRITILFPFGTRFRRVPFCVYERK